jgi:hypothetical protein
MADYDYRHLIEYSRPGQRASHSEEVQDHGWYINKGQGWRVRYTTGCASETLTRKEVEPGEWIVIVWRLNPDGTRDRVCSIRYAFELSPTR